MSRYRISQKFYSCSPADVLIVDDEQKRYAIIGDDHGAIYHWGEPIEKWIERKRPFWRPIDDANPSLLERINEACGLDSYLQFIGEEQDAWEV